MRSHYELYKILKKSYDRFCESDFHLSIGICHVMDRLYTEGVITPEEHSKLKEHFINQRPTPERNWEFYGQRNFRRDEAYWWDNEDKKKSDKSRKYFLEKMIMITKPERVRLYERIVKYLKKRLWR